MILLCWLVFLKQEEYYISIWVRCLSGSSKGFTSEPILLSKFGLIMHLSSLLFYSSAFIPPLILPSVRQVSLRPHTTFCALCPTLLLLVCVLWGPCQSLPVLASVSLYVFKLHWRGGRRALRLTLLDANWCRNSALGQLAKSDILPQENQRMLSNHIASLDILCTCALFPPKKHILA